MRRHPVVSTAVFTLLALGLCVQSAWAQGFGRNKIQYRDYKWSVLSTPHFDIHYYQGSEAFAVRAALVLEDGYEQYSYQLKEVLPWKVPVILYASHADFLETNVSPEQLSEGVQAFAEPSRRRIVLPFTSSFKEFEHTAIHELAHVFTFNIVYNRMLDNVFTRNYLFPMPLWVAEGLAEYLAEGWDADADMFIRDAVIHDYLYPFYMLSGFYVYKEGQSVFNYIAETYGPEKVLEILDALAGTRSAQAALQRTIGLTEQELYDKWAKSLRKHYWPLYPDKQELDDVGRRLTDHEADHGYYNTKPILSPDGEYIVFFSDRSGMIEIYVMSALDGKVIAKVVTGSRSNRYESLHLLTSSICFDPTGDRVAFVAKNKGHDALFVKNIKTGDEWRCEIESDGLTAPAWNPTSDEIALSATFHGQTDLLLVNLADGKVRRLTNDAADQLTPRFFPDGTRLVFVHYPEVTIPVPADFSGPNRKRLSEIDFQARGNVKHGLSYDIWEIDVASGAQRPLVESPGDDTDPIVLSDGKTLIYASDESGVNNLHAGNIDTGDYYRFTDVLGGLFTPSVHEEKGRIAFSAFVRGGWDVYVSDDLSTMLTRRYLQPTHRVLAHDPNIFARRPQAAAAPAPAPASTTVLLTLAADSLTHAETAGDSTGTASVDSTAEAELPGAATTADINAYEPPRADVAGDDAGRERGGGQAAGGRGLGAHRGRGIDLPRRVGGAVQDAALARLHRQRRWPVFLHRLWFWNREQRGPFRHARRQPPHVRVQPVSGHRTVRLPPGVFVAQAARRFCRGRLPVQHLLRQPVHVGRRSVFRIPTLQRAQLRRLRVDEPPVQQVLSHGDGHPGVLFGSRILRARGSTVRVHLQDRRPLEGEADRAVGRARARFGLLWAVRAGGRVALARVDRAGRGDEQPGHRAHHRLSRLAPVQNDLLAQLGGVPGVRRRQPG